MADYRYLKLLAREYPNIQATASEIINLKAILSLPKGTEYFFSDLHGEHEAFLYLLRSASGVVRKKIDELFEQSLSTKERTALAQLIYSPETEIPAARQRETSFDDWCRIMIYRLVEVCKEAASKYTRSKVRKRLPKAFDYIIDELLHADGGSNKPHYHREIVRTIVETQMSESFISMLCRLIQQLLVDRLHIIGDIFDRGPRADAIMDELMSGYDVDIQWGNHDVSWMGAAAGNWACICNVLRLGISYNTFDLLEDGYGINLRPLSDFATHVYGDDPCEFFKPHTLDENKYDPVDIHLAAKMHKAMAILQFKVEGQMIRKHPEYKMDDRILLERVDYKNGTVEVEGHTYKLRDTNFPTINPENPLELTDAEAELIHTLSASFLHSERLQKHIAFLYSHGGMYQCVNGNLMFHGCIPLTEKGTFEEVEVDGHKYAGKAYFDFLDAFVRKARFAPKGSKEQQDACDYLWYLWCGAKSPLFGKSKMSGFEHCFIEEPEARVEVLNPYYAHIENRPACEMILEEFGLNPKECHIMNGHVPVRPNQGESPVKGDGILFMIDGGISKAYQRKTGIGGYTFIDNSRYLAIAEHKPFCRDNTNVSPRVMVVQSLRHRVTVEQTDTGAEISMKIADLQELLAAYRSGLLKEK